MNRKSVPLSADFDLQSNPADGSPENLMNIFSNDEAECMLQDGRFRLYVGLRAVNGKLVDNGTFHAPRKLYFDRVTIDDWEMKPTKIEGIKHIYETEAYRDGAVIGVWYHTEN